MRDERTSGAPSFGAALGETVRDARALLAAEWGLLRAEASVAVRRAGRGAALLGAALILGIAVAVMVLVSVMAILDALGVPTWLAAVLTTLLAAAGAAALAWAGIKDVRENAVPRRTVRELREDRDMIRERMG